MRQRRPRARWTNAQKPVIPLVDPTRVKEGDWVRFRLDRVWLRVESLEVIEGVQYVLGEDVHGTWIAASVADCTPAWNPETQWYGHQEKPL